MISTLFWNECKYQIFYLQQLADWKDNIDTVFMDVVDWHKNLDSFTMICKLYFIFSASGFTYVDRLATVHWMFVAVVDDVADQLYSCIL